MNLKSLLAALADGEIHSGEELALLLNVTRAAVWKRIQQLMALGIAIEKIHAKGYRLQHKISVLDEQQIRSLLPSATSALLASLDIPFSVASTNAEAMQVAQMTRSVDTAHIVLAEHQAAGRGRRGKVWQSPVAGNIYLSCAWHYRFGINVVSGMSVAIGVAVAEALNELFTTDNFKVKWPNDIWWDDHKVAGILIEAQGDATSDCTVVIGIGVNVVSKQQWAEQIAGVKWQTLADIAESEHLPDIDRNRVAAVLIEAITKVCRDYVQQGIANYQSRFKKLDALAEREVIVDTAQGLVVATAKGIDRQGLLQVECDGVLQSLNAAEVSLRIR